MQLAPTAATTIPTNCGLLKLAAVAAVSEVACAEIVLDAGELLDGDPMAVEECTPLLVGWRMLELVDVDPGVVVAVGAINAMLGIDVSTIRVAVIVPCVLGRAFACPEHMLNAAIATFSTHLIS